MISYDDFQKLDIRIGTIHSAEKVPGAHKLLKLSVDIGEERPRTLVAGIAPYVPEPETLIGKQIPVLTNLEHKTIHGIESEGMILAASCDNILSLLYPSEPLPNGSKIQ